MQEQNRSVAEGARFKLTHSLRKAALALAVLVAPAAYGQSTATETQILYHEAIDFTRQQSAARPERNGGSSHERWSFTAMGKRFDLVLRPNTRLLRNLPADARNTIESRTRLLTGHIDGVADSWVRLTQSPKGVSALLHDGTQMFVIEPAAAVASSTPGLEASSQTVFYPLSQVFMTPQWCAAEDRPNAANNTAESQLNAVIDEVSVAAAAQRELNLAVYVQNWTGDVLARLNAVDGIYQQDIGVELNVVSIETGNYANFGSGQELQQFRAAVSPRNGNTTANHLFVNNDNRVGWAGIAYVGLLCNGAGISKMVGNLASEVTIVAHEIGHNFGASHDGQAGACSAVPNQFIMWPSVNRSTSFSDCSVNSMQPTIGRAIGQCIMEDTAAPVSISANDVQVDESSASVRVTVSLSSAATTAVAVTASTGDGTATAALDFSGRTQRLNIPAGQTSASFDVSIIDDNQDEPNETFRVILSDASNATIARQTATVTIIDDDDTAVDPEVSVANVAVTEDDTIVNVPVTLSAPSQQQVSVRAFTQSGTATTGRDFFGRSQLVTFAPGSTRQSLPVRIIEDGAIEANEAFTVRLTAPQGADIADGSGSVRINDDDTTGSVLSAQSVRVTEASASLSITLSLSRPSAGEVSAIVFTRSDTAVGGEDYYGKTQTIVFNPGEVTKQFVVTMLDDRASEGTERFSVIATSITGASNNFAAARVQIIDND